MRVPKCRRSFIPPFIMENLARAGISEARLSFTQSMQSRDKRSCKAISGEVLAGVTPAPAGRAARQVYNCKNKWTQHVKADLARGEGDGSNSDAIVNKIYDYAGNTRDYLKAAFDRDSVDNLGMNLILNVHYGVKYMNAFWDGDEMTFGDGDGKIFVNFAQSLEVVAHELAHGITQHMAALVYQKQSGALNEHFSDVFGSVITQTAAEREAGNADWLIGDEIMGPELYGEALRSMRAPGTAYDNPLMGKDPQPDHMKNYFTGSADNYGVHINSGIPNKAFCLAAKEIGTDKATLIWYTALQNLWPTAQFNDAVTKIAEAARILVRDGKVPAGSTQKVRAAFKEVGLPA